MLFAALAAAIGFVVVILLYPNKTKEQARYDKVGGAEPVSAPDPIPGETESEAP